MDDDDGAELDNLFKFKPEPVSLRPVLIVVELVTCALLFSWASPHLVD